MNTTKLQVFLYLSILLNPSPTGAKIFKSTLGTRNHSRLDFSGVVRGVSLIRGSFEQFSAEIETADISKIGQNSNVTVIIESTTVLGVGRKRVELLRSSDFFNSEKNPTIRFRSKTIQRLNDGTLDIIGDLLIREKTAPLKIHVDVGKMLNDTNQRRSIVYSFHGTLLRSNWDLNWGNEKIENEPLLSDAVRIEGEFEFYLDDEV